MLRKALSISLVVSVILTVGCSTDTKPVVNETMDELPIISGIEVTPGKEEKSKVNFEVNVDGIEAKVIESQNEITLRFDENHFFGYEDVDFPSNQTENNRGYHNFINLVDCFKDLPEGTKVTITAHTDNDHDEKYNLELTTNRANYLLSLLQDREELKHLTFTAQGFGQSKPIVPNDGNAENKDQNRRIDFILQSE
ncbi:OmpA family protein [Metabacillus malikii]|uniref:Outer membrane protein OmpA-like peptidoglycan-associated protein n=1 Tax=Metabacillus malikii TaxID=1504265 RepID=A0ABT9ZII5_9BACI|nr:OmpA family protein [Metabacillus malikii]MDQ0231348.1 outer membrane protein OmpA-like peptidoglycan-associated protein [Metabacillus malikii]